MTDETKTHYYGVQKFLRERNHPERCCLNKEATEQFPREVEERRRLLYPLYNKAKSNPNNAVKLIRDKLYVNGQTILHSDIAEDTSSGFNGYVDNSQNRTTQIGRANGSNGQTSRRAPWGPPLSTPIDIRRPWRCVSATRSKMPPYPPPGAQNIGSMFSISTHNGYETLNNLRDRQASGLGTYLDKEKKNASSPVSEQILPPKIERLYT